MSNYWPICLVYIFELFLLVYSRQCTVKVIPMKNDGLEKIADCSDIDLSNIPRNLPPDINVLDLSNNHIKWLQNSSFENYKDLTKINLNNNKLSEIDQGAFLRLEKLEKLSMTDNSLNISTIFTVELFIPLQNLLSLDIRRNIGQQIKNITVFYPDISFSTLTNLTYLALDIAPNPVFGYGFRKLQNLKSLIFDACYLTEVKNNTFDIFPRSVENFGLLNCKLHFVKIYIGALLPFPYLMDIDFTGSCIHLIQALNLLYPFKNKTMKSLIFSSLNCPIFNSRLYPFVLTITQSMMQYLKTICVQTLDLSDNGIVDFESESLFAFGRPECLRHLILKGNRFTFTYKTQLLELKSFFNNAVNLKTLDYSEIPVRYQPNPTLSSKRSFLNQHMESDDEFIFVPLSLESLIFHHVICFDYPKVFFIRSGSNLTYLDVSFGDNTFFVLFPPSVQSNLQTLIINGMNYFFALQQMLHIPDNRLTSLTWRDANLDDLVYQMNRKNELKTKLFQDVLRNLRYIQSLDISKNSLWTLTDRLFTNLKNLSNLNLSKNLFQLVPDQLMLLTNIKDLDLRDNRLTTVDIIIRNWADEMQQNHGLILHLKTNAFQCTCNNIDFIKWVYETKVNLDSRSYSCTLSNGTLINTRIAYNKMHELFSDCNSTSWVIVGISVSSTVFLLFFFLLFYNHRWEICLIFYRKFKVFVEKKMEKYYTYDVYISYGCDCLPWIKNTLLPKLESQWKLKLCIKDRDFLFGGSYSDDEAESIEKSRHVIFLITPTFKTSHDCLFEIDRVKYEKRLRKIENIIVIAKDITIKDIPIELSYIWNYVTLIQWPNESENLDITWKKLKMWIVYNERMNNKV